MTEVHGNLLIGGMTLKNLMGKIEDEAPAQGGVWHGALTIDLGQSAYLECGRPYRLELEDGRAAKVMITRVDRLDDHQSAQIAFDGLSSLESGRHVWEWDEEVEASC